MCSLLLSEPDQEAIVATFRVYLRHHDGQHGETVVQGTSFPDALAAAQAVFPAATFTRVWMVDDSASVILNCPRCRKASSRQVGRSH